MSDTENQTNTDEGQSELTAVVMRDDFTLNEKAKIICRKIKTQFTDQPEQKLFFAIIEQAIKDFALGLGDNATPYMRNEGESARRYLSGEIVHAEMCDVDSDWIRHIMKRTGMPVDA